MILNFNNFIINSIKICKLKLIQNWFIFNILRNRGSDGGKTILFKYHEPAQWHTVPLTCHRGTRKSSNLISRKCGITFCPANTIFFSTFPCRDFSIILGELLGTEVGAGKVRMGSKKSEEKSPLDSIENLLCRWTRRTLWILVAIYFSRTQGSLSRLKEMRVSRCFENIYLKVEVLLS